MKKIKLSNRGYTIIDSEDYQKVSQFQWWIDAKGYARRWEGIGKNRKVMFLHTFIIGTPKGYETDHINHNRLDNRKINLRIVTKTGNMRNRGIPKNNKSGYKGVFWYEYHFVKGKWAAYIKAGSKRKHLGYFKNKINAAIAYNEAAIKFHGEFAVLNKL